MNIPKTSTLAVPFQRIVGRADRSRRVYSIDRWLAEVFLHFVGDPALQVTLWDGKKIEGSTTTSTVGMVIHDRAALLRLLANPLLHFGDDYSAGRIEIEGGLVPFLETVYQAMARLPRFRQVSDPAAYRRNQPRLNSLSGSRHNIHHHYDIGNDFYQLWLDTDMNYTFYPGLATLSVRLHRQFQYRRTAAVSGRILASSQQPTPLDTGPSYGPEREVLMETCEVLVVGGGPAGSTCAGKLVQEGLDVLLLDKELFPREKPCAGWITPVLFEALELDAEEYRQGRVLQRQSGAVCRAAESPFRQRKFHHLFVTDILLNLILSRDQAALQRLVYAPYPS